MILRAQHDILIEEELADEFAAIKEQDGANNDAKAEKLAQLQSSVGARMPFADDDLMEELQTGTVPDIRNEHTELSNKLNEVRKGWKERYAHRGKHGVKFLADEEYMKENQHTTPAERWRQRKQLENA